MTDENLDRKKSLLVESKSFLNQNKENEGEDVAMQIANIKNDYKAGGFDINENTGKGVDQKAI